MIRHRPFGLGHPYRVGPDQRSPVIPIAGEPFELRATTDDGARAVWAEIETAGERVSVVAQPLAADSLVSSGEERDRTETNDSHLASAAAEGLSRHRRSWVVRPEPLPYGVPLRYRFVADARAGRQRTTWYTVNPARWESAGGRLLTEPTTGARPDMNDPLVADSGAWLVAEKGPLRVRFALRLEPAEHVVGFGERFNALDQRGQQLDVVVFEQYKTQGSRTYLPMPFAIVVGGDGWGFHIVTSRRTWFDVGKTDPSRLWIEAAMDPDEMDPVLRIELFRGSPVEVLRQFLDHTGHPKLPPGWVFRPWMSGNEWNTQARVMTEVARSQQEDIPVGVIVIEAWSDEATFVAFRDAQYPLHPYGAPHRLTDFRFPADGAWPDPAGMVADLHSRGIKVLLWQVPLLKTRPAPVGQARCDRDVMVTRGYAVREANGRPYRNRGWWFPGALLPDFTSSEVRDWWIAKRRYLVEEVGIDGFKTDGGEHAWGDDLQYADRTRGDAGNNRYPVAYTAACHELFSTLGRQGVTLSRAGFNGSDAYPCHWAGDENSSWEAFRASITAGLTAGASGIFFWGWDLAGFSGEIPDAELFLRAAAMACFCPIMQFHSEYNHHRKPSRDRTPWNIQARTGDERVVPIYRRFAKLRESLVPYLMQQAQLSVAMSRPLMRALCFDAPRDLEIWNWPYEYLLGDDLLIAPVVEPATANWQIYLPKGEWVDAWTGSAYTGPSVIERNVPLQEIPVYLRGPRMEKIRSQFLAADQV